MLRQWESAEQSVKIAVVGKYVHLSDTYKSLHALKHGGIPSGASVELTYIDAEELDRGQMLLNLGGMDAFWFQVVWRTGHRRKDSGHSLCVKTMCPSLGFVLGCTRCDRICRHVLGEEGQLERVYP